MEHATEREIAPLYWLRVVNTAAQDYDRIGWVVETIEGGDLDKFIVLDFNDGKEPTAFTKDELEPFYVS